MSKSCANVVCPLSLLLINSGFLVLTETGAATPHYNASVLSDLSFERNLHHLYKCALECPAMKESTVLIKVWLHQRRLDQV